MIIVLSLIKGRRHRLLFHVNVTKISPPPPVFISRHELDISSSFTKLGHLVSSNLSWKTHIHSIAKHASQKLGFLSRARGFFSPSQLITIYKSQVRPSLEYFSHIWGGAPRSSLHFLEMFSPKPSVSYIIQVSLSLSNLPLLDVWLQICPFSIDIFVDIAHGKSRMLCLIP